MDLVISIRVHEDGRGNVEMSLMLHQYQLEEDAATGALVPTAKVPVEIMEKLHEGIGKMLDLARNGGHS